MTIGTRRCWRSYCGWVGSLKPGSPTRRPCGGVVGPVASTVYDEGVHRPFRYAPPPLGRYAFVRGRLLDVVAERFNRRLIVIEAGAGFGKTTLLVQALADLRGLGRDAYLSCDGGDSTPSRLLAGLLRALGREPAEGDFPTVGDVVEAAWAISPDRVCLVLDDVHWIDPRSAGMAAIVALMADLPANASVVLAGRRLPVHGRARLVATGQALELTEADLVLTPAESCELARRHGVDPVLLAGMSGWPALAELAAVSGQAIALRFVEDEVLSGLDAADRFAFVVAVAIGGGEQALLDAAVGQPVACDRLAGIPLVSFDHAVGIRPHHLWAELLTTTLLIPGVVEARRRAAGVLSEREEFAAAFEMLAHAADWDAALVVLVEGCNDQRRPPWGDLLAEWRRLVPSIYALRPEVIYLEAMIERVADPWSSDCRAAFDRAVNAFRADGQISRAVACNVRASYVDWIRGDAVRATANLVQARTAHDRRLAPHTLVQITAANLCDITGDTDGVRAHLGGDEAIEARLGHFPSMYRALAEIRDGDADRAIPFARRAADAAQSIYPAGGTGFARILPIVAAWNAGHHVPVDHPDIGDPGPRLPLPERVPSLAVAATIAAHHHDLDQVGMLCARIGSLVRHPDDRGLLAASWSIALAAGAVARGDESAARRVLSEGLDPHELSATGAGRIVGWLPVLPYLFNDRARTWIDTLPRGPSRQRMLAICAALLALRSGDTTARSDMRLDGWADWDAVLTVLPPSLAAELAIGFAGHHEHADRLIRQLAERHPIVTREALNRATDRSDAVNARHTLALRRSIAFAPTEELRIRAFGPLSMQRGTQVVDHRDWRRERVRQLLATLISFRSIRRERLGLLLWPEFDEHSVSANLRMTLTYLQAILEPGRQKGDASWFLRQDAGVLQLRDDASITIDAWRAERHLDAADAAAAGGMASQHLIEASAAVALWQGEYLADLATFDWAAPIRQRMHDRLIGAATRAGELLVGVGRLDEARAMAERALVADQWAEPAHRVAITACLAAGDRTGARHAYDRCRAALDDLGVVPDRVTETLAARITAR